MLFYTDFFGYSILLLMSLTLFCNGLAKHPESTDDMPEIKLDDNNFEPEQMGHINMASFKEGRCPEVACPLIKAPKPCPHARPVKTVFRWMDMDCEGCSSKWDPESCKLAAGEEDEKSYSDVVCPELTCPPIKDKKPCKDALPVPNKLMYKGKQCRGCPIRWNTDSCDPEKRKKMDFTEEEPFLDESGRTEL